jgi:DNA processing protein
VTVRRLVGEHGGAEAAFAAAATDAATSDAALARADRLRARCAERGIAVSAPGSGDYPAALLDLEDPPPLLYTLGALHLTTLPSVAIVGPRLASPYGRAVARDFARRLAGDGVCVVSGLAMGVDAEAHAAALDARGATIAVQGTGVDVAYPRSNRALHERIARDGLVVSELPPGRAAHPGAFPRRNRIIAALADVVVVVEAGVRSGALITAQLGGALGRLVAAVPGPVDRESSVGSNQLLRDGAHVVASVDDVCALLALTRRGRDFRPAAVARAPHDPAHAGDCRAPRVPRAAPDAADAFPPDSSEGRVLALLSFGPQGPDELVRACGISPRDIGIALSTLTLQGIVTLDPAGVARRTDGTLQGAR